MTSPELVGFVTEDSTTSVEDATHCGGVLRTVSVVLAVCCASTFNSSVLPALNKKTKVNTLIAAKEVAIVILPAF
jgi:hypothetical protein